MNRKWIVTLVVGTLAFVVIAYTLVLGICAFRNTPPPTEVLSNLKDVGVFALGSLAALLTRTSEAPQKTEIMNSAANPIPTVEQPHEQYYEPES